MTPQRILLVVLGSLGLAPLLHAQNYAPPPSKKPDEATLKQITTKSDFLGRKVATLRRERVPEYVLRDVEIFHKAATWIVQQDEFYDANAAQWTLDVLDRGLLRASQVARGEFPWLQQAGHPVVRAYRSRIDGSLQPYSVTFPASYSKDARKRWRIDVVLHGRDPSLTEVKFLQQHTVERTAPVDQEFVQIDIFGRGNNAYRWAGEADVFEAVDAFYAVERQLGREPLLDTYRVVLRGFSMGGAGSWHIGLHHPDRFCVIGPGAGFTTTRGYVQGLTEQLPSYIESCLRIYDAVEYAENAFNVPVVAYAGEKDAQLQAARNIEERLKPHKLPMPMTLLVAPELGHQFPLEWQRKAEQEYVKYAGPNKGRSDYPVRVRFVTYTLKYPSCDWVEILGLDQHYERALVEATKTETGFTVKTTNVRALRLGLPAGFTQTQEVSIDEQKVKARPNLTQAAGLNVYLEKRDGRWKSALPQKLLTDRARRLQKYNGLQGPIDDAFTESFLCVRGTGKPWHDAIWKFTDDNLKRFRTEWAKYMRGELAVRDDVDVTEDDVTNKHLILFGDPSSNSLIAEVLDGLPLTWTRESITLAGKTYPAAEHVPAMIYPNPLNSGRYVVLNSGHTFHAADFLGTNALLYPRLGDYAILKPAPTEKDPLAATVVVAGICDDFWRIK